MHQCAIVIEPQEDLKMAFIIACAEAGFTFCKLPILFPHRNASLGGHCQRAKQLSRCQKLIAS